MRNLKTKDYLGKARLVAASDRANAFTGFTGSEIKNAGKADVKDDRPADNISFAATNLVKPGIQSRVTEEMGGGGGGGGGGFPPTPPPENDRPGPGPMSRGASVRNGPKPMLTKLNIAPPRSNSYTKTSSPQSGYGERRMQPPSRSNTNSEVRSPPQRGYSQRDQGRSRRSRDDRDDDGYPDDVYDLYDAGGGGGNGGGRDRDMRSEPRNSRQRKPSRYGDDEPLEGSEYDSFDEGDFEMVSNRRGPGSVSGSSRAASRRPDIRKVRIKVHSEDVRYIMVPITVEFTDLVDRVRDKFGLRRRFKIKVRDGESNDMITMGDQDDLEMVMMEVKSSARKQRLDAGKLEVSFPFPVPRRHTHRGHSANPPGLRFGSKKFRHFLPYWRSLTRNDTRRLLYEVMTKEAHASEPMEFLSITCSIIRIIQH